MPHSGSIDRCSFQDICVGSRGRNTLAEILIEASLPSSLSEHFTTFEGLTIMTFS